MGLELRQQVKLTQQLVMTPQLQQAIKLLQLSRLELIETIQQEMLENPLLEEKIEEEVIDSSSANSEAPLAERETTKEVRLDESELLRNADWEDYLGEFSSIGRQSLNKEIEIPEEMTSFESRLAGKITLEGHLEWQLRLSKMNQKEMAIGEVIIGNLDSNGYLKATIREIAEMSGEEEELVESVLRRVQVFDPVGVAASSPRECLLIQLDFYGYDDPIIRVLVEDHLEDLEKKRYKPIMRRFDITLEQIRDYLQVIQKLDPIPGAAYSSEDPHYVSPDVYVYKSEDEYVIILNEEGIPRLGLMDCFWERLNPKSDKDKDYVTDRARSAHWLIKSLHQRQRTLYKVMESIVKFQRDFFDYGVSRLKPLILRDVSEDIGVHESTVSRITTMKYAATPHGIFELKFFFNSAVGTDDGGQVGSESVKAAIKTLISDEDTGKPLSDDAIVDILKKKFQINIARRTVAKYRTAMGIDSSAKRKRMF